MKKVSFWGFGLVLMVFDLCFGVQTETMRITKVASNGAALPELEYRVTLFQDSFLLYDPVGIQLWVKNLKSDTAQVWFDRTQGWILQDQNGKLYPSTVSILYAGPQHVPPGDSLGGLTDLDYGFKIPGPYPNPALPAGEYSVYYKIDHDSTAPLKFRVVEPKGEEGKALALYLAAFSPITGEKFALSTPEQRIEFVRENVKKLLEVVARYPKSVYAIDALPEAMTAAWIILHDHRLAYEINARMMREYPDSRLNGFDYLKEYYKGDPARLRTVLDSIIAVDSHPRIIAGAKKTIEALEKEKK